MPDLIHLQKQTFSKVFYQTGERKIKGNMKNTLTSNDRAERARRPLTAEAHESERVVQRCGSVDDAEGRHVAQRKARHLEGRDQPPRRGGLHLIRER